LWKQPPFSESVTAQWSELPCHFGISLLAPPPPSAQGLRALGPQAGVAVGPLGGDICPGSPCGHSAQPATG